MNLPKPIRGRSESVGVNDPLTRAVIGKAMETHSAPGPGLVEEFYHQEFSARLSAAGLEHESKPRCNLVYRGFVADTFEPDMLFAGQLIPELKALRGGFDPEHFSQLISYLKFHAIPTGLLFDFSKESLGFKRVVFTPVETTFPDAVPPAFVSSGELAVTVLRLLREIHATHGVGFRETTYQGLFRTALQTERIPFSASPTSPVGRWGVAQPRCFVIDNTCAVSVGALGDEVSAADRAILQTCLRWLDLPWGIAVHFGRRNVDLKFVVQPKKLPTDSERPRIDSKS